MNHTGRTRHALLVSLIAMVVLSLGNVVYTRQVQSQTQHKFCGVVRAYDAKDAPPPTTARAIQLRNSFKQLRRDLGCK